MENKMFVLEPVKGAAAPTDLIFPSGRIVHPDARGRVTVGGDIAVALLQAGWRTVEPAEAS